MRNMKRVRLLVLWFLFIPVYSFSQNGYKDYSWGMTIEQVEGLATDLTEASYFRFAAPSYAIMYLYSSEITSGAPNPLSNEKGEISSYKSENQELTFYFLDNKLLSVEIKFFEENIIAELIKRYGNVNPVLGSFGDYQYETACWDTNPKKLIVWEKSIGYRTESVYYIDGDWFSNIRKLTINTFREEKQKTKSKLD